MDGSVYLQGVLAPVREEVTVTDLSVTGSIPVDLAGRYVRTGPNPLVEPSGNYHLFLGDGMVHGVALGDGAARWYRNRWVRSPTVSEHLGEDPVPRELGGWYPGMGNTNVFGHAGRIWAVTEGSLPYELTPELTTVAARNFGGPLPAGINAHPKFDPDTGEMHVLTYGFAPPYLRYHVIDAEGWLVRSVDIDLPASVMVHDMGLTATRVVLFDLPVVFDLEAGEMPFVWRPDNGARVGLLPRDGSTDPVWVDVEPCYVYHPLNAYDDGDCVVIDLVVHRAAFTDDGNPGAAHPTLQRWTIDPVAGKVATEVVDERAVEFPRADERLTGRRHRYGYMISVPDGGLESFGDASARSNVLRKHDLQTGATIDADLGPDRLVGEMVFVPASGGAGEDEGWLVGFSHSVTRNAGDLLIVDAHDFGAPVATVHLPVRVPFGFHGNWVADAALA